MADEYILDAALKLTGALDRAADENLPGELAGIVKLHAALAVGAAFVPIPVADMAAAVANIWAMYIRINKAIDVPFEEHVLKSIATGLVTNLATSFGAAVVLGSIAKLLPGLGSVAGAVVTGATVYSFTIAAGYIYMTALAKLLNANVETELQGEELKSAINELMSDRETIKTIVEGAKQSYRER